MHEQGHIDSSRRLSITERIGRWFSASNAFGYKLVWHEDAVRKVNDGSPYRIADQISDTGYVPPAPVQAIRTLRLVKPIEAVEGDEAVAEVTAPDVVRNLRLVEQPVKVAAYQNRRME